MKRSFIALALVIAPLLFAQTKELEVKYIRDSAEYATAARQVYRLATTWLPVIAGVAAYLWSRTRRRVAVPAPSAELPILEPASVA